MSDPEDEEDFCVEGGCQNPTVNGARCEAHTRIQRLRAWLEAEIAATPATSQQTRDDSVRRETLRAVLAQLGGKL